MMKRAPGCASAARRLRVVGTAATGPASRAATSRRLRATMRPSTSAIARLDIGAEHRARLARQQGMARARRAVGEVGRQPRGPQQGPGVERDDVILGALA